MSWRTMTVEDFDLEPSERTTFGSHFRFDTTLEELLKQPSPWFYFPNPLEGKLRDLIAQAQQDTPDPVPFLPSAETDWTLLGRAVEFYKAKGYTYVEAPWAVTARSVAITCPKPQYTAQVDGLGSLVGSAEQSLLHLVTDHHLPVVPADKPYYVACTPCFRLGDVEDGWHFPYFMKVELFTPRAQVLDMIMFLNHAGECFRSLGVTPDELGIEQTDQGVDILINGYEVGSYGMRAHQQENGETIEWTYGTGLALPRFSQAKTALSVSSE